MSNSPVTYDFIVSFAPDSWAQILQPYYVRLIKAVTLCKDIFNNLQLMLILFHVEICTCSI